MDKEVFQMRVFLEELQKYSIPYQICQFVPMPDGVKALHWEIVCVVACFATLFSPVHQCSARTFQHLLRLFIEKLLRHLLPGKLEVSDRRNKAQSYRGPGREKDIPFIPIGVFGSKSILDWLVGKVARRNNMWYP